MRLFYALLRGLSTADWLKKRVLSGGEWGDLDPADKPRGVGGTKSFAAGGRK